MMTRAFAVILLLTGLVLPTVIGIVQPRYDPVSQYLSELGAVGAPHAALANYGGFLLTGLALLGVLAGLHRRLPAGVSARVGLALIALVSVSYIGAVFAPCEMGCPADGSARQQVHNLLGLLGYAGGLAGLFVLAASLISGARGAAAITLVVAILFTAGFLVMATPDAHSVRGAAQRLADFSLFIWAAILAFRLPRRPA